MTTIGGSCFNPRARTGRDLDKHIKSNPIACFNPRARTGRDVGVTIESEIYSCFNPRARTGRDQLVGIQSRLLDVSIHAPARGATRDLVHFPPD